MTSISQTLNISGLTDVKPVTSHDDYPDQGHNYVTAQQQQSYFTRMLPSNDTQQPVTSLGATDYEQNVTISSLHQSDATSGDSGGQHPLAPPPVGIATSNFSVNHLLNDMDQMPKPYYMHNMLTNSLNSLGSLSSSIHPHPGPSAPPSAPHDVTGAPGMHMTSSHDGMTSQTHENNNTKHLQHLGQHSCATSDPMTPPPSQFTPNAALDRSSGE